MSAHHDSNAHFWRYWKVFAALMVLTGLTVWVATLPIGDWHAPAAVTIAVIKAFLVVMWFMHVAEASRLVMMYAACGFLWLFIMFGFTMGEVMTRDRIPYPGPLTQDHVVVGGPAAHRTDRGHAADAHAPATHAVDAGKAH